MTDVSVQQGQGPGTATRRIGHYEVLRPIGRGGMAVVYLARQAAPARFVALKELGTFESTEPQAAQRFVREAQFAGSLNHPNIITVHEYFEDGGIPYIAMEYARRGSLRPYVGSLSLCQVIGVLEGVLAGLAHAEQAGIVHRDLKPENLMVTEEGRIKIADFGIAKATLHAGMSTFMTSAGMTVGTPIYMAPEQAIATDEIGPWSDLYSVGIMAYEHLVGRAPFRDEPTPVILFRHVNDPVRPACEVAPHLDSALSDWIDRLLAKAPADRTQSAVEAWDSLEDIVIDLLGPRWRRDARLGDCVVPGAGGRPLTPAPFFSTGTAATPPAVTPGDDLASLRAPSVPTAADGDPDRAAADPQPATILPAPAAAEALEQPAAVETALSAGAPEAGATRASAAPEEAAATGGAAVGEERLDTAATAQAPQQQPLGPPTVPPEQREPSTAASPPTVRRRRLTAVLAVLGVVAVVAAVVGLVLGGSSGPTAKSGPIAIEYGAPWTATTQGVFGGASLVGPVAGGSAAAVIASQPAPIQLAFKGANLVAGSLVSSAPIPGDVPPALRARYGRPFAAGSTTIGGSPVREYRWQIDTAGELDAFVIPTTAGDLAIICTAPTGASAALHSCVTLASAATLTGAQLLAPGPDSSLAAGLSRGVAGAAAARSNLGGLRAGKLTDRAAPALAVSHADATAASSLTRLAVPPRYQRSVSALASAFQAEAAAFVALSSAAQRNDANGYTSASNSVTRASRHVAAAAAALQVAGLSLPALPALGVPGLPAPPQSGPSAPAPSSSGSSNPSGSGGSASPAPSPNSTPSNGGGGSSGGGGGGSGGSHPSGGGGGGVSLPTLQ